MLDYNDLPSLDTVRGKLFWGGIFGVLTVSCLTSAVLQKVFQKK